MTEEKRFDGIDNNSWQVPACHSVGGYFCPMKKEVNKLRGGDPAIPKKAVNSTLGDAIKTARVAKGMTQAQLAEILGVTTRYVKLIENSGRRPSLKLVCRIIEELGIPPERIF